MQIVALGRSALAALLLLSTVGCAGEPRVAGPSGTVVISSAVDIRGVNLMILENISYNRDVMRFLFLQLLRENPDFKKGPPTFEPALAESYELSPDGLDLTFRLRTDAVWSDGAPITAADVRWTWQAQTDANVAWSGAYHKDAIEDVEVVDDHTVVFHFTKAYPAQLADANEGWILPRHVWGQRPFEEWRSDAGWFEENLVTSGPFRLEAWTPGEELRLVRNELYYEPGLPKLEKVVLRVIPDKISEVNQLLGGAVDYVQKIPNDQAERIRGDADVELEPFWGRQYNYLTWNSQRPPLGDRRVRRALTQAIDRRTIIDTLYGGRAKLAIGPVLSSTWGFNHEIEPWPFDPAEARRLLAEQGFEDADGDGILEGKGGKVSIDLLVDSSSAVQLGAATLIQEQLRQVGVELKIRSLEFNTFVELLTSGQYEGAIAGWQIDTSLDVGFAFHSDPALGNYNFGSYANAEVDRLISEFKHEERLETKRAHLRRLQEILHEDQPYTFLWEVQEVNARNRRLRGTAPNSMSSLYNLAEWYVEP